MGIKIGVVGAGHLGKIHLKCLAQIPEFEVVGFADSDEDTRAEVAKTFEIQAFADYNEMFPHVQAVSIVTPTTTHFEVCEEALNRGLNVFVEKPVCTNTSEAERLIEIAEAKAHLKCQVGHVERFNPVFLEVKDTIGKPEFIEVHRLANFNPRSTDVSVVHDLMIHDLDLILHMVPHPVKEVRARGVSVISPTFDIVNARVEFEGGCVANITASRLSIKNMRKLRVFQSDAYLSLDFLDKAAEIVRLYDHPGSNGEYQKLEGLASPKYLDISMPDIPPNNAIVEELKSFYRSITNDTSVVVSLQDGLRALELAELISARSLEN